MGHETGIRNIQVLFRYLEQLYIGEAESYDGSEEAWLERQVKRKFFEVLCPELDMDTKINVPIGSVVLWLKANEPPAEWYSKLKKKESGL